IDTFRATIFMKSFDQTFSKVCGLQGQSPWSRPQARNSPNCLSFRAAKYVLFWASLLKKNGEGLLT
ncbi:MAG: hypothetical protein J6V39_08055, partial [Clostridia bacterium]|nr:hypothetical protein [Clostridia bacterium]